MTLTDIATTDVVTASLDTEIRQTLDDMDEHAVGSVVVTDGDEPAGLVTDRMIAMAMRDHDSVEELTAGDVATEDLVTASDDDTHFEVLQTMSDEGIRRLPVVEDGSLTGIVTLDDMIVVTAAELSNAADVIEQQSGPL